MLGEALSDGAGPAVGAVDADGDDESESVVVAAGDTDALVESDTSAVAAEVDDGDDESESVVVGGAVTTPLALAVVVALDELLIEHEPLAESVSRCDGSMVNSGELDAHAVTDADAETDALVESEGVLLADAETDALVEGEGVMLAVRDADVHKDARGDAHAEARGVSVRVAGAVVTAADALGVLTVVLDGDGALDALGRAVVVGGSQKRYKAPRQLPT